MFSQRQFRRAAGDARALGSSRVGRGRMSRSGRAAVADAVDLGEPNGFVGDAWATNRERRGRSRHSAKEANAIPRAILLLLLAVVAAGSIATASASAASYADSFSASALDPTWTVISYDGSGSATVSGGALTLSNGGTGDFWGYADTGTVAIRPAVPGGTRIEVEVVDSVPSQYPRFFGVRSSPDAAAAFVGVIADRDKSHLTLVWRDSSGAHAAFSGDNTGALRPAGDHRLRLDLSPDAMSVDASVSPDGGASWIPIGSRTTAESLPVPALLAGGPTPTTNTFDNYREVSPDADGDGVPDAEDACAGTIAGTVVAADGCPLQPSLPALVRGSTSWLLRDALSSGDATMTFSFGAKPLVPIMGDWDANGSKTPGTFESGVFKLSNTIPPGAPTINVTFGDPRGFPVVGDFNADGVDDLAVYRAGTWQFRVQTGGLGTAGALIDTPGFVFGSGNWPHTIPVAGDWDGNGTDGIGLYTYATGTWQQRQTAQPSGTNLPAFTFWAGSGSYPIVGDWNADATDSVAVKHGTTWQLNNQNDNSPADITFNFGLANDLPLSWKQPHRPAPPDPVLPPG